MHEVKIVIADAGHTAAHAEELISGIPQYYAAQYRTIKKKQEADQELTAGFLLKKYLGVISDEQIIRSECGKPMMRSENVFYNISHSGKYVILAVADMDIGVDIEKILDVHWPAVEKIFPQKQKKELEQTPESAQPQKFTRIWTECEAVLKLLGTGFAVNLAELETAWENDAVVHSIRYREYIISCAAYEEFYITVKKEQTIIRL